MDNIIIRKVNMDDITSIQNIHRGSNDPWDDKDTCTAWISKRISRGFYIQIAEYDNQIVGHGEWIVSNEPDNRFLYLGMLEIDEDYQKMGIGSAMVDDGIAFAKKNSCNSIVTIPDLDTGSYAFYIKHGFVKTKDIFICTLPTFLNDDLTRNLQHAQKIPFESN